MTDWEMGNELFDVVHQERADELERATQRFLKADRRAHALEDELSQMKLEREVERDENEQLEYNVERLRDYVTVLQERLVKAQSRAERKAKV